MRIALPASTALRTIAANARTTRTTIWITCAVEKLTSVKARPRSSVRGGQPLWAVLNASAGS